MQQQQHLPTSINNQTTIGWGHFCRGRISELLTQELSSHYINDTKSNLFTGIGWSRTMVKFLINLHLEEWYIWCSMNVDQKVQFEDK